MDAALSRGDLYGERSKWRVSARALLMAGVTAVGIATAVPHGPVVVNESRTEIAVMAENPYRVSSQEVQLTAYVPGVYEVGAFALNAINAVDSLLTAGVDLALSVMSRIPLISALAPQLSYMYFCVARSFVYFPLAGAAHFATTMDFRELARIGTYVFDRLARFVRFEIDYFLNLPRYLLGFEFVPEEFRPSMQSRVLSLRSANLRVLDPGLSTEVVDDTGSGDEQPALPRAEQAAVVDIPAAVPISVAVLTDETVADTAAIADVETVTDVDTVVDAESVDTGAVAPLGSESYPFVADAVSDEDEAPGDDEGLESHSEAAEDALSAEPESSDESDTSAFAPAAALQDAEDNEKPSASSSAASGSGGDGASGRKAQR